MEFVNGKDDIHSYYGLSPKGCHSQYAQIIAKYFQKPSWNPPI